MQPIGNTYLVKMDVTRGKQVGDIVLPDVSVDYTRPYIRTIEAIGTTIKNGLPVGTKVVCNYNTKNRQTTRLILGQVLYYIYDEQDILGVLQ